MVIVWFFIVITASNHGIMQAGPFQSAQQCEEARVLVHDSGAYISACYKGVR
jgi:hypothetical protein